MFRRWKELLLSVLITLTPFSLLAQEETPAQRAARMEWFADAKLGIFIHWGIYAVKGIDESWSFYNGYLSYDEYMKQCAGFTASRYDPVAWARLFAESGARYAVLTSKHHDGVALWNTALSDLNVVKRTPAKRDLIQPYCAALRTQGLKVGLYFSHLDWSHPDYPIHTAQERRYGEDSLRWRKFVAFRDGQVEELAKRFAPDLFWFDGDWDFSAERWDAQGLRRKITAWLPSAIVNSRLNGFGDYATPEQGVPIFRPQSPYWELCMTINDSWGYQGNDRNFKTGNQVIRVFVDCIGLGGNLLLDIGPKEDGTVIPEQVEVLKQLGRWTTKHREAIYGTRGGIPPDYYLGRSTISKDSTKLYLFVDNAPKGMPNGQIVVRGLKNSVGRAYVVGNGTKLRTSVLMKQSWNDIPGLLYIDLPESVLDSDVTVVALVLDGPVRLHAGPRH
jgi:alpha-L-fucosidase